MPRRFRDAPTRPDTWGRRESRAVVAAPSSLVVLQALAEARQGIHVLPPIRKHLRPEIEIDALADQVLDFLPRRLPDRLDLLALGADQNALLAVSLDVQDRPNVHRFTVLTKLLDLAGDAVGQFVRELLERGLPNQLAHEEARLLGADLVRRIQERALGQPARGRGDELV